MEIDVMHILNEVEDKRNDRHTTSHKFKKELLDFFKDLNLKTCIEVGTASGNTTRILSYIFNKVVTIELNPKSIKAARDLNSDRNNIEYLQGNAYESNWGLNENFDVAFIDCVHQYDFVASDYNKCKQLGAKYFVFDDYGLNENEPSVKAFVDFMVKEQHLEVIKYIGEPKNTKLWKKFSREDKLIDWEGVITKLRL
jgi:hypothetical protein